MKNLLWVMISGSLCTSPLQAATILAGPVYNPATTHSYFLLTSSPWTDAEAAAVSMGGHLVTVNDAAENDWLLATFSNFGGQPRALWTGLTDRAEEGAFFWSSGEPVSYTHWEVGQPDDGGGIYPHEDYVLIWPSPGPRSPGYWNDYINTNTFTQFSLQVFGVVEVQGNNWTNPFSAKWESPSWSLGTLPASDQAVAIMNDGYKAVNIDSTTVADFPDSLTVGSLEVGAPTSGLSTLLLNYFGLNTPLTVLNACMIQTNGTLLNLSSRFEVDGGKGGALTIDGGTFTQEGGLAVVNAPVDVRSGSMNATNGNLTLGEITLGTTNSAGTFNQDGGSIAAQQVSLQNGTYNLASGTLYAIGGAQLSTDGAFNQSGGTNYGDITMYGGHYNFTDGLIHGNLFSARGGPMQQGNFSMTGGVLDMQEIDWSDQDGWYLSAYFRQGTVRCGSFNISGSAYVYVQVADVFVTNNVELRDGAQLETGFCHLRASTVTMYGDNTYNPTFWQGSGIIPPPTTNMLSSGLTMYGGQYILNSGTLQTPYIGVGLNARIAQEGGLNLVQGVLSMTGSYEATGGSLVTEGLYLRGWMLLWGPPIGLVTFTNRGLLDLGGSLGIGVTNAWGGQVRLSTNATINFIGTPAQLRFAASSDVSWTPGALLVVANWNNSGNVHLIFGSNASALTPSQLAQIQFASPGGFAPGHYPAQLLSTGELVPIPRPTLEMARTGSALVLNWAGNYQLFSATNVAGPYSLVPAASSPWTNFSLKPMEFFLLQGSQ